MCITRIDPYRSISRTAFLGRAPTLWFTGFPSLNTRSVGMLITPNCVESSGSSSTFTLPTEIPWFSSAISSTTGDIILQGPHQDAQKSTSTVPFLFRTSSAKLFLLSVFTVILDSLLIFCPLSIDSAKKIFRDFVTEVRVRFFTLAHPIFIYSSHGNFRRTEAPFPRVG